MEINELKALEALKTTMQSYSPISNSLWLSIEKFCTVSEVVKGEFLLHVGQIARYMHFIYKGAFRTYFTDENGNFYNKNIFIENQFPASKVSLLLNSPSYFCIEALENSIVVNIAFSEFKNLMNLNTELKNYYIAYIEKNWIIKKELREISLVMDQAKERYLAFLDEYPNIEKRIAQHQIAAHLGITPNQLSRIRKNLKN